LDLHIIVEDPETAIGHFHKHQVSRTEAKIKNNVSNFFFFAFHDARHALTDRLINATAVPSQPHVRPAPGNYQYAKT
jgi:hypothetical protein